MWQNAERDRTSGKYELAVQGYLDYLKWFGNGPRAADAQYWLGYSYYTLKDYDNAVKQFDSLLENYTKGPKIAEALFYKGKSLLALDRKSDATETFRKLRTRFPSNALVRQIPR
jgi:tol-pal system protein YbgF